MEDTWPCRPTVPGPRLQHPAGGREGAESMEIGAGSARMSVQVAAVDIADKIQGKESAE